MKNKGKYDTRDKNLPVDRSCKWFLITFAWRFSSLSQSEIRVHWWTHYSIKPTDLGRREFTNPLTASPLAFTASQNKSTRVWNPASYAGYASAMSPIPSELAIALLGGPTTWRGGSWLGCQDLTAMGTVFI